MTEAVHIADVRRQIAQGKLKTFMVNPSQILRAEGKTAATFHSLRNSLEAGYITHEDATRRGEAELERAQAKHIQQLNRELTRRGLPTVKITDAEQVASLNKAKEKWRQVVRDLPHP